MIRLLAVAAATAVVLPYGAASTQGEARSVQAGVSVVVANLKFTPKKVGVALGETVTWSFPEAMSHTTTSDQAFWNSGTRRNGATYARAFTSAGKFRYHCEFHFSMRGVVKVPLKVTGSPEGWKLRWSTIKGTSTRRFDVQTRRGSGPWKSFRTDTKRAKAKFHPARAGSYKVRARSSKGAASSGWSPVTVLPVS